MAECDAVLEIRDSNRVRPEKRIIIIIIIIIIITRQLQSLVTVRELTSSRDQTDSWTGYRMDRHTGLCQTCYLSYHMIISDHKSQSYNSKYTILSHNVLMVVKTLWSK